MKDDEKTREQPVIELKELRLQYAALEKAYNELELTKISESNALEYSDSIINTIHEPLIALDETLKVVRVNHSFCDFFQVTPEETIGKFVYDLGNGQWNIPKLRELLETILPQKSTFDNYEIEHNFDTIGTRIMLVNARQVQRALGKKKIILLAIEDVTQHKRLERLLEESEYIFRRTYETANDAILLLEKREGKIAHVNPAAERMFGYAEKESIGNTLEDIGVKLSRFDIKTVLRILDEKGIIHYNSIPVKTKFGQFIDVDVYIVNKAHLLQCNIRDVSDRKRATDLIEGINRSLVGRELRMIELKEQVAEMGILLNAKRKSCDKED